MKKNTYYIIDALEILGLIIFGGTIARIVINYSKTAPRAEHVPLSSMLIAFASLFVFMLSMAGIRYTIKTFLRRRKQGCVKHHAPNMSSKTTKKKSSQPFKVAMITILIVLGTHAARISIIFAVIMEGGANFSFGDRLEYFFMLLLATACMIGTIFFGVWYFKPACPNESDKDTCCEQ